MVRQKLYDHEYTNLAERLIAASLFRTYFPPERLETLRRIDTTQRWDAVTAVQVAIASSAFGRDHAYLHQIPGMDWIDTLMVLQSAQRICDIIPSTVRFEQRVAILFVSPVEIRSNPTTLVKHIKGIEGQCDAYHNDSHTIYEFKNKLALDDADRAQLLVYIHIMIVMRSDWQGVSVTGILFNALTNERWSLQWGSNKEDSLRFMECLFLENTMVVTMSNIKTCIASSDHPVPPGSV